MAANFTNQVRSHLSTTNIIPPNPNSTITPQIDHKILSVRDRVLQLIRNYMPITTLFTPELKIDLNLFVEDQIFLHEIAESIAPLAEHDLLNAKTVAQHFEESGILQKRKKMFEDSSPYLQTLYEICSDVLHPQPPSHTLKRAIEGRIFTLKNAFIAIHDPLKIQKSQREKKVPLQTFSDIKEEGIDFIRESLHLHLRALQVQSTLSFREQLTAVATQLIPFVKEITDRYLREHRKDSYQTNPLTCRNPSGYNYHGMVAAAVMEAGLKALGYTTRVMERTDLEPRVTLATMHKIIEVVDQENKYLIDPAYIQFHKDACLNQALIPKDSVLILEESEVDAYIDEHIMVYWKENFEFINSFIGSSLPPSENERQIISQLEKQDLMISLTFNQKFPQGIAPLPKLAPPNSEDWVRKGFKRAWELSTYTPIISDPVFQAIFYESTENKKPYEWVKPMNIPELCQYPSHDKIRGKLNILLSNPAKKSCNDLEALRLMACLPESDSNKYASLLDLDPRLTTTSILFNTYFRSLRKMVNPQRRDLRVVYGCSGGDCTTVLFATDAKELIFVDTTKVTLAEFEQALKQVRDLSLRDQVKDQIERRGNNDFFKFREKYMGMESSTIREHNSSSIRKQEYLMKDLPLKLFLDMESIGIDLDTLTLNSIENEIQLDFTWQYHGAPESRHRRLIFVTADITTPEAYPPVLQKELKEGIDIFYMKGAYLAPLFYEKFLPYIAQSIQPEGWLMTTDKTVTAELIKPEPYLEQHPFKLQSNEEIELCKTALQQPWVPFDKVGMLEIFPPKKRNERFPTLDLTYWSILNLRQKTPMTATSSTQAIQHT